MRVLQNEESDFSKRSKEISLWTRFAAVLFSIELLGFFGHIFW